MNVDLTNPIYGVAPALGTKLVHKAGEWHCRYLRRGGPCKGHKVYDARLSQIYNYSAGGGRIPMIFVSISRHGPTRHPLSWFIIPELPPGVDPARHTVREM